MARQPVSGMAANAPQAASTRFGALVRERRRAMRIRIDELALVTGVGRKFVMDLEAGKPTCQLGKALAVAEAVGLRIFDLLAMADRSGEPALPVPLDRERRADATRADDNSYDLPDLIDDAPPSTEKAERR